jgi:hypothetical protein
MFVNADLIRSLEPSGGCGGGGGAAALREGMKVEGNYRGKGRFYKGVIRRENRDGSFDIDYDDVRHLFQMILAKKLDLIILT